MRDSKLEVKVGKSKPSLLKRARDYMFKLGAYIMDGVPIDKNVSVDNNLVYGRF